MGAEAADNLLKTLMTTGARALRCRPACPRADHADRHDRLSGEARTRGRTTRAALPEGCRADGHGCAVEVRYVLGSRLKIASALLRDQITVEPFGGDTATGPVYGPAVTYAARIAPTARMVRTPTGEDVHVTAVAVVRPEANVTARSLVTHDGTTYVVLTVAKRMQLTRTIYQELALGWAD